MANRFYRYTGRNWQGREFYVAEPVRAIGDAMIETWPVASGLDGTVASEDHDRVSSNSDHRPHPFTGRGIVRAIDIGVRSDGEGELIAGILRRVRTVNYVLFGANVGHARHVHVSTNPDYDHDNRKVHMLSQHAVQELNDAIADVEAIGSDFSGGVREAVKLVLEERQKPLHRHTGDGDGGGALDYGDTVKLAKP